MCRWLTAAVIAAGIAPALAAEATQELPAGSVAYAGANLIVTDSETVVLRHDSVRVTTVLRSIEPRERPILMAFALPDIDMAALDGTTVSVLSYDPGNPTNFIGLWMRADGGDVPLEVEQRALSLGLLDATAGLARHGVPLYPLSADVADILTALPQDARDDLLAQSLIRLNEGQYEPLWTLRTAFHWRQPVPASRPLQLTFGYQPVAGSSLWTEDSAASLTTRFCVSAAQAATLTRRAKGGATVTASWVHFQPGASGHLRGPIGDYTVDIEKTNEQTVVATCREGFKRAADGTLQFKAVDHVAEDDILVLFVD
jgi:hypothetical protein